MISKTDIYKRPSNKERDRLKRCFSILHDSAQFIKENFINKKLTYYTKNQDISIYFSASNFMHLCGIEYEKGSHSFFVDCLNKKINIELINIKKDGTTFQKLQVLPSISELLGNHVCLTGGCRFLYLEFDYSLRTNKQILALTLIEDIDKIVLQSLLDLKQKKDFPKGEKVLKIYSEELDDSQQSIIFEI